VEPVNKQYPVSMQKQLELYFVLALGVTVFIMGAVWVSHSRLQQEDQEIHTLVSHADLIGAAMKPAFIFGDTRLAGELLPALQTDTDVSAIRLFSKDGKTLIASSSAQDQQSVPYQQQGITFSNGKLAVYRTVLHKGSPVGVVYAESSLSRLKDSRQAGLFAIVLGMLSSLLFGLMIARVMQKKVAGPIGELARLMRRLGAEQDYSLRAAEALSCNREVMELASGFNQMAGKIQTSFQMIEAHQAQLIESEERFRDIVDLAPVPIVISRLTDGEILFCNQAAGQLAGIKDNSQQILHATDLYHNPDDYRILQDKIAEGCEIRAYELQGKRVDDMPAWISLSASRMLFEQENSLFSVFADITDQKNVERTLERINQQLEHRVMERTSELGAAKEQLQSILDNMLDTY